MRFNDILDDFSYLDDWEDRYRYVIELGRGLEPLPDEARNEANKVKGCVSQVWLLTAPEKADDGALRLNFIGDSDAHIVQGLIAIVLSLYSGKTPAEIREINAMEALEKLGLNEHLTPQRSNGVAAMIKRIRADAEAAMAA